MLQQSTEDSCRYDINTQEVEQKSTLDVSVKRFQKANKELLRHNTQLAKLVDNLKKEKELLVSERVKLKTENKSLEKELKKVGSKDHRLTKKMSQPLLDDDVDALREKIHALEDQLMERDQIVSLLKLRLGVDTSEPAEEIEKSSNAIMMKNGYVLDSSAALDMLLEEHDTTLRLKRENEELRSRLASMEAGATEGLKGQRELVNSSPRTPRKRSSGFFKRGKKNTSSGILKHEEAQQVRADLVESQSPEVMVKSDSHHEQLDTSLSPLHSQKESSISLPNYNTSPNLSPHTPTKNRAHAEIVTLQSCLRIALEEKSACNECLVLLEKELDGTRSKIMELEESIATSAEKANVEIEQLKSDLKVAKLERDTFSGELKIVQQEVDDLVDMNEDMDRMYTESLGKKNKRIQELEQQIEALTKGKVTSPPYNKPPAYGFSAVSKKQVNVLPTREKVLSPPHQSKEIGFGEVSSKLAEPSMTKTKQLETKLEKARGKQQDNKLKDKLEDAKLDRTKDKQQDTKLEKSIEKQSIEKQQEAKLEKAREKQQDTKLVRTKEKQEDTKLVRTKDKQEDTKLDKQQDVKPEKVRGKQEDTKLSERQQEAKPDKTSERKQEGKLEKIREMQGPTLERIRAPSVDSARHEQTEKKISSQETILKVVPPSPSRRTVGRLSRESSIDRFECPPVKEIRKISTFGIPSPSLAHSPKVAATRAMFEQKIDETKTDLSNVRKISRTSVGIEQRRRSSTSTASLDTGTKETVQRQHSKSYSYDFSSKQTPMQKLSEQSTGSVNQSKAAPPTPVMEQIDEPRAQSNEAKNKVNTQHQQQEKAQHSGPVAAARKLKPSDTVAKVSRITITSVASPTSSPILSTRKDLATSSPTPRGDQSSSAMLVRHPTSPSLGTSHRISPSPAVRGQIGQTSSTRVSTVSSTVRHSPPTINEIPQPATKSVHAPVSKSQTESRIQPPMNRSSGFWSISNSSTATTTTTPVSTTPTPANRVVVKSSSRLGDNLLSSSVNKAGSLQNISAQFSSENRASPQNDNSSSTSAPASSSGIKRGGPTHRAMQRRERKDRPKTMFAGRAETANLVNLISRFQEAEKDKQLKDLKTNGVSSQTPSSSVSPLKMNGTSSSTTPAKSSSVCFTPSSMPGIAPLRQSNMTKERQARPTSYCSTNNMRYRINSLR